MDTFNDSPFAHAAGPITVRALFLGERIDLRALETTERLAVSPLVIRAGDHGCAVLFRYGAVVLFGLTPVEEVSFLGHLAPLVVEPLERVETEETQIIRRRGGSEVIESGTICLEAFTVERLQLVADALAKSVVLAHYEGRTTEVFNNIEPLAAALQHKGKGGRRSKELLRHIGGTLMIHNKTVGRVEMIEKPDLLWDHPELERLYLRLTDEYDLQERQQVLERKLQLISRTAETMLDLLQNNRSLRVEWYIVILIVVEILLTLYELFFRH